jgi:hypothetical protein
MALRPEMVYLIGFCIVDDIGDLFGIREVPEMEEEPGAFFMGIDIDVVNP